MNAEPCISSYSFDLVVMAAVLFFLITGALMYAASFMQHARRWRRFVDLVGGEEMAEANLERLEVDNAVLMRASMEAFKRSGAPYRERLAKFGEDCQ